MKILVLTKYPALGPSSRYRFHQFLPALREAGHVVTVLPLMTEHYLEALFSRRRVGRAYLMQRLAARVSHCVSAARYDLVWIEGELVPFMPAPLERLLHALLPRRRVYDFDDANWLRYEGKRLLHRKFRTILSSASGIVVGNHYLERYVRGFHHRVAVIPTVVDWGRYEDAAPTLSGRTVGWIGSTSTVSYVDPIVPALRDLSRDPGFRFVVVGAPFQVDGVTSEAHPWTAESEVALIESFDVGIMPLTATPWSEGKCGLKLIQYLATGVPAVASPVGVNSSIIHDSGGGFLADTTQEWSDRLRELLDDRPARVQRGGAGRDWVRSNMTVDAVAPRLIAFLESC